MCVYVSEAENVSTFVPYLGTHLKPPTEYGTSIIYRILAAGGFATGTWAVTSGINVNDLGASEDAPRSANHELGAHSG